MYCPECQYRDDLLGSDEDGIYPIPEPGSLGGFYHSTFADLERRKDRFGTEKAKVYGCPACGRVFIETEK